MLFSDFRYLFYMPRKSNTELLPFDPEIKRTLFRQKKVEVGNSEMEDQNSDRFSEGHSSHNEMPGLREPTLGDCWRPMMNKDYLGILHQPIYANDFELKPELINSCIDQHGSIATVWGQSFGRSQQALVKFSAIIRHN